MKHFTIISTLLILLLPLFSKAQHIQRRVQTDSSYYEKRDSEWVEIRIITKPFTKVDTLLRNTLMNEIHDKTVQLYNFRENLKAKEEETYTVFKRNSKQLKLFNRLPDMPRDTLKGNWNLNDVQVTIKADKIGNKKLTWYSEVSFEYQNELFIKQENDLWVSNKSKLVKIKAK